MFSLFVCFVIYRIIWHWSIIHDGLQILSDPKKRAHYDSFLIAQRRLIKKRCSYGSISNVCKPYQTTFKQMEVVEWLKSYRIFINGILSERKVVAGTGYFDVLERDFYSAMHIAFYGPTIESMELLPDCFEAEERSTYETSEILHLVSGRDLFGMVCFAEEVPKVASATSGKSISSTSSGLDITQTIENASSCLKLTREEGFKLPQASMVNESDAYKDLELHICGKVIAWASRLPPKFHAESMEDRNNKDQIHVFLSSNDELIHNSDGYSIDFSSGDAAEARIPLGTIVGLGTSEEEESCFVYNKCGTQTHVIMKHRTLMVCIVFKLPLLFASHLSTLIIVTSNAIFFFNLFICLLVFYLWYVLRLMKPRII